ncbi:ribosome recycling factor [Azospirillum doebereinerae]|uniref:Ribosome-recycling factor n=1 Tax=Azospirillum doebereinerae TaxID=92933 RepID=A0A433J531_9PROT|nr:ribosome recycling factor [Azospirillum doebereinerae]MCG5240788.1 ribosome recycling factor [Azospirillum doebereinerae]RUQ67534.1 ribosome recycling factor [Azospirillum doebereinerae]
MAAPDVSDLKRRMEGAIESFRKDLTGLRTGRASSSLLEPVSVEAYGNRVHLKEVATVSVPEPRLITVQVWDRSMAKAVEKAIRDSGLGLNPQAEGQVIRVPLPDLTQERRTELTKVAHKYAEQTRIAIRNIRRDGMDALKKAEKASEITQDEHKTQSEKVQTLTDQHIKLVDDTLAQKEKDIMQV